MTKALEGVRVLDFLWAGAGAWGSRYLASYGAEVIRFEWKGHPDGLRYGPVTTEQLLRLAERGQLAPSDRIWPAGSKPEEGVSAESAITFPQKEEEASEDVELVEVARPAAGQHHQQ